MPIGWRTEGPGSGGPWAPGASGVQMFGHQRAVVGALVGLAGEEIWSLESKVRAAATPKALSSPSTPSLPSSLPSGVLGAGSGVCAGGYEELPVAAAAL